MRARSSICFRKRAPEKYEYTRARVAFVVYLVTMLQHTNTHAAVAAATVVAPTSSYSSFTTFHSPSSPATLSLPPPSLLLFICMCVCESSINLHYTLDPPPPMVVFSSSASNNEDQFVISVNSRVTWSVLRFTLRCFIGLFSNDHCCRSVTSGRLVYV